MQCFTSELDVILMDDEKSEEQKINLLLKTMTKPEFLKPFVLMLWKVSIEIFEQRFGHYAISKIFRGLWRAFLFLAIIIFALAINVGWLKLPDVSFIQNGKIADEQTK